MGRRGGGGGFRSGSAFRPPRRAPAAAPKRAAAPKPATTTQTAAPAPYGGGGGYGGRGQSFLGGVAQIGAGVAVGHVAGRALENMFFGGHGNATPEQVEQLEEKVRTGPCAIQFEAFDRCIKSKGEDDIAQCEWVFDSFKNCQLNHKNEVQLDHS
eukprot:TRINITY_DN39_c0_g1_i1.p1 TRINITY_DN39_c0_g1~~TRINITY_DN39_c0_g1_i1.p1  ORF type:complete len:155 (-),score=65.58 TRINITY_DN39_c0_g1_i1:106-570(-)